MRADGEGNADANTENRRHGTSRRGRNRNAGGACAKRGHVQPARDGARMRREKMQIKRLEILGVVCVHEVTQLSVLTNGKKHRGYTGARSNGKVGMKTPYLPTPSFLFLPSGLLQRFQFSFHFFAQGLDAWTQAFFTVKRRRLGTL